MTFYASFTSGGRPLTSIVFTLLQMTEKLVMYPVPSQCFIYTHTNKQQSLHVGLQTLLPRQVLQPRRSEI